MVRESIFEVSQAGSRSRSVFREVTATAVRSWSLFYCGKTAGRSNLQPVNGEVATGGLRSPPSTDYVWWFERSLAEIPISMMYKKLVIDT